MHFIIEKKNIFKAINNAQGIIEKKVTSTFANNVLLELENGVLKITSTDLDILSIQTINAEQISSGKICICANLLFDVLKKIPDGKIEFELQDNNIFSISLNCVKFNLLCMESENFPKINKASTTDKIDINSQELFHLIDCAKFSICSDDTRYNLAGIYFHSVNKGNNYVVRAASSDLHRITCISLSSDFFKEFGIIIGKKACIEIQKLIGSINKNIEIGICENRIEIFLQDDFGSTYFSSRLINGFFPDYSSVEDLLPSTFITFNNKDFLDAVDRVGTVITDKDKSIKIILQDNTLKLSGVSSEFGSASEEIAILNNSSNLNFEIFINANYVLDSKNLINSESIDLFFQDSNSPILLKENGGNKNDFYAIMPLFC